MVEKLGVTQQSFSWDKGIAGDYPLVTREVIIESGQNLKRFAVLGKITASGKHVLSEDAATDGSEIPDAILARDADASSGDVTSVAYFSGQFAENNLTIGTGHTADSIRDDLRDKNIYLGKSVKE